MRIAECRSRIYSGCEVDWSPDGKTLAVTDGLADNWALYLLDLSQRTAQGTDQPRQAVHKDTPFFAGWQMDRVCEAGLPDQ